VKGISTKRLAEWYTNCPLHTLFAHSHGGTVALLATRHGLMVKELILLSAPAEPVEVEWRNVGRAVSLRIHVDLILLANRRRQFFTENVEERLLPQWFVRHDATHNPAVWHHHGVKQMLGL
jgi:pimeloyl-ACP methyl ester carboxylesterase